MLWLVTLLLQLSHHAHCRLSLTEKSDLISRIKQYKVDESSWRIVKRAELGYHMAPVVTVRGYGSTLAFTCSFDGSVHIYSTADISEPSATGPSTPPAQLSPIMHYAHSLTSTYAINAVLYDGRFMYSAGNDGEIHVSDVEVTRNEFGNLPSPTRHRILKSHQHWIWALQAPPDQKSVLMSSSVDRLVVLSAFASFCGIILTFFRYRTVKVWDVRAANPCMHTVSVFQGPVAGLSTVRYHESIVATASFDNTVRILDPRFFGSNSRSPVLAELRVPNHSNLTRCDLDSDWLLVACQSMDVHFWQFRKKSLG
jgi:WD40 repeat protein